MSTQYAFGRIVTSGLVLSLNAADRNSYPGSGTVWNDMSGNGNNGTLTNGPTFNSANGGSIVFDGTNDLVTLPLVLNTASSYTIEVVAKSSTMTLDAGNRQTIWSLSTNTFGYQLLDLSIWGGTVNSFNGNGTNFTGGPVNIASLNQINDIHFYTLSTSGGVFSWYIDSTLRLSYSPTYTASSLYFKLATRGDGVAGTNQVLNGSIYDCKIYNRALSASEVAQNYNAQKSRFNL